MILSTAAIRPRTLHGLHAASRLTVPLLQFLTLSVIAWFLGISEVSRYSLTLAPLAVLFSAFELSLPNVYIAYQNRPRPREAVLARLWTLIPAIAVSVGWMVLSPGNALLIGGIAAYRVSISFLSLSQAIQLRSGDLKQPTVFYLAHAAACMMAIVVVASLAPHAGYVADALAAVSLLFSVPLTWRQFFQQDGPKRSTWGYLRRGVTVGIAASMSALIQQAPIFYIRPTHDDMVIAQSALIINGFAIFLAGSTAAQQVIIYAMSRVDGRTRLLSLRSQTIVFIIGIMAALLLFWGILPLVIKGVRLPILASLPAMAACALLPLIALVSSRNLVDQLFHHQLFVVAIALITAGALYVSLWEPRDLFRGALILSGATAARYGATLAIDTLHRRYGRTLRLPGRSVL